PEPVRLRGRPRSRDVYQPPDHPGRGDRGGILEGLKARLMEPDLFEEFAREFLAELNRQRMVDSAGFERARPALKRIERQIARLVAAVAEGEDAKAFNQKIKELEAARRGIEAKLAVPQAGPPLLHPNLAKIYRDKVETLTDAFRQSDERPEIFEL